MVDVYGSRKAEIESKSGWDRGMSEGVARAGMPVRMSEREKETATFGWLKLGI